MRPVSPLRFWFVLFSFRSSTINRQACLWLMPRATPTDTMLEPGRLTLGGPKMIQRLILSAMALLILSFEALAMQIAPLGSKFEARLTNESESRLSAVAELVGQLVKEPVHEEITQLGFGCPVERDKLIEDASCRGGDAGFVNPFIIYGVRWNDLPPFRLNPRQGAKCRKAGFLGYGACNVEQTVRFSTQPDCWLCLFKEAEIKAEKKKLTGCEKGPDYEVGTLMTRSHFGDLQFFHSMANEERLPADETRQKVLDWIQFAWKVFSKEFTPDTLLKTVEIPTIAKHFGCSEWTVSDIYILGRTEKLRSRIDDIAFGSVLHTVQDSFAAAHTTREAPTRGEKCVAGAAEFERPGRIVEFHTYGAQDGHKHDAGDQRSAMAIGARDRWPEAVAVTSRLFEFYNANASWETARPYLECVFELSRSKRPSSPGEEYKRAPR